MRRLLALDPKDRIGAHDALEHPWFDKYCPAITLKRNFKLTDDPKSPNDPKGISLRYISVESKLSRANTLPYSLPLTDDKTDGTFIH